MKNEIILVVDDDPEHLLLVERYVSSYGHQCISAHSGAEALEYLKAEHISVVVTDMVMPAMDGMELLEKVKKKYPATDVIVMTGYSKEYSYIDVIKAGATDFIEKPFMRDEFSAKLDRLYREKHILHKMRQARKKAEVASKAKTAFLCTISHELRTPMSGILGFTDILRKSALPPEEMKYLEMLSQSSDRLWNIIRQILNFSENDEEMDINTSHFSLKVVFDELFAQVEPKTKQKGLQLNLDIDASLAKMVILSDQPMLTKILSNLLDNAIKFTDSGSIDIRVKKSESSIDDNIALEFSIADSGCGIEEEKQWEIFNPFTQTESFLTREHQGAGLGLAICAKLVNVMNGKIWVESQPGKGSTFFFTIQIEPE